MEILIYAANTMYLAAYAVNEMLYLRLLTIVATSCLAVYFYTLPEPLMTVVYWNLFFLVLNAAQLARILRKRRSSPSRAS